jgi:hypothetical protein
MVFIFIGECIQQLMLLQEMQILKVLREATDAKSFFNYSFVIRKKFSHEKNDLMPETIARILTTITEPVLQQCLESVNRCIETINSTTEERKTPITSSTY